MELGPPAFWQAQDVNLAGGQTVVVDGTVQDDMVHPASVTLEDGQDLSMRTETGQPLWSGGVEHGRQGENGLGVGYAHGCLGQPPDGDGCQCSGGLSAQSGIQCFTHGALSKTKCEAGCGSLVWVACEKPLSENREGQFY